jgi:hypothetical protein
LGLQQSKSIGNETDLSRKGGILMATYNITVTVPSSPGGTWLFSVDGGPNETGCVNLADVPYNESITFQLTLQPENTGDTVAYNTTTPLQFVGWQGQNLSNPMWYNPSLSSSNNNSVLNVLTFTDDSLNVDKRTYIFKINATYNGTPETSPDPTIINAGTGGVAPDWIEEKVEVRVTETLV